MKKQLPFSLFISFFLVGCSSSGGIALTKDNVATYIGFSGGKSSATLTSDPAKQDDGSYLVVFYLYPLIYDINSDVKGDCEVLFTPHYTDLTSAETLASKFDAAFSYKAGGTDSDGIKEANSLEASFSIESEKTLSALSVVSDLTFTDISGSVQG
ncbi:MAG: hypothetical protein LKG11_01480 [Bacilli bacterium]|jgi:hypothetical protein|nr:hypothetical protein [Bacilli bacterium]